jgi:hypothetical protein
MNPNTPKSKSSARWIQRERERERERELYMKLWSNLSSNIAKNIINIAKNIIFEFVLTARSRRMDTEFSESNVEC